MTGYNDIKAQREEAQRTLASLLVQEEQEKTAVIQGMTVAEVQRLADAGVMSKEDVARLFQIKNEQTEGEDAPASQPGNKKKRFSRVRKVLSHKVI